MTDARLILSDLGTRMRDALLQSVVSLGNLLQFLGSLCCYYSWSTWFPALRVQVQDDITKG